MFFRYSAVIKPQISKIVSLIDHIHQTKTHDPRTYRLHDAPYNWEVLNKLIGSEQGHMNVPDDAFSSVDSSGSQSSSGLGVRTET